MESSLSVSDSHGDFESQDDDFELSPADALEQLESCWRNELLAPELLPMRADLVDSIMDQVQDIEASLKDSERTILDTTLRRMEVDRIRYMITSYLRCRLQKIERYVFHIVAEDDKCKREGREPTMSPEESRFAKEYQAHLEQYFQNVALQKMPSNAQKLDRSKIANIPELSHFVFVRMKQKVPDVMIPTSTDDTQEIQVDLDKDSQHVLPFKVAAPLMHNGSAFLM